MGNFSIVYLIINYNNDIDYICTYYVYVEKSLLRLVILFFHNAHATNVFYKCLTNNTHPSCLNHSIFQNIPVLNALHRLILIDPNNPISFSQNDIFLNCHVVVVSCNIFVTHCFHVSLIYDTPIHV